MIKILHTAPLRSGGITSFVLNLNEKIDHSEFEINNLCFRDVHEFSEDRFLAFGGRKYVIDVDRIRFKPLKMLCKYNELKKLIKREKIDIFHFDTDTADQVFLAIAAKRAGAKVIYHSHNSETWRNGKIWLIINELCKRIMVNNVDVFLACSESAAKYMFPKKILINRQYDIVTNGIDSAKYVYNETIRHEYRKRYEVDNKFVVGHVGRFNEQKNHVFLIDIFCELLKIKDNSVLFLVGEGELYPDIENLVISRGISEKVVFAGRSSEVNNLMQMMDCFLFPSLFEGLPVAGVEAQASGLPLFLSDTITSELDISNNCYFVSLDMDASSWAKLIIDNYSVVERHDMSSTIRQKGYDINSTVEKLEKVYHELKE